MKNLIISCALCLVAAGCSTKKDRFISRAYHSTTAKFNPLFNGNEALRYGVLDITQRYEDNYWLQLPVDPYALKDPFDLDSISNEFFDRAEEKAILTVQKHSMLIEGEQRNKQIAKAYLLLGKARYFNGRYPQAVEALTYLIKNMGDSEQAKEAELWRAKTYLAMGQHERAARELTNISVNDVLSTSQYAIAQASLADALLRERNDSLATHPLRLAYATEKSAQKRGRYAYLLGQVYEKLSYADSAIVAYQQVLDLNRRIPRELWIHARLAQLKNNSPNQSSTLLAYRKLLRSDEDRRFRDKIHYFYGSYLLKGEDTLSSELALNASLQTNTKDRYLKSLIYEQFAANRLDQVDFVRAGAYLDSTLQNLEAKTRRHRKLTRKRAKLDDIISYEKTIVSTDSILRLMAMSPEEQRVQAVNFIEQLKAEETKAKAAANTQEVGAVLKMGSFYFYNSREVEAGKRAFQRDWGTIQLSDNWKYNPTSNAVIVSTKSDNEAVDKENPIYNPQTYLDKIPPMEAKDSIQQLQHEAYFQAGLAYKEQFNIKEVAVSRFTSLLNASPETRYIPPTLYHLYQLYNNNPSEQRKFSTRLLKEYPDGDYAKMLRNPGALTQSKEKNEALLAAAKKQLAAQKYTAIIAQSEQQIPMLTDKELQGQWAMLRAISVGRLDGLTPYKEALTNLVQTYPKTQSAKKAQKQLNGFAVYDTIASSKDEPAKLVFVRTKDEHKKSMEDKVWIEAWLETQGIETEVSVSIDVFDRATETLVIHGFNTSSSALETQILLRKENPRLLATKNIVILASDYRNALIHKRLNALEN